MKRKLAILRLIFSLITLIFISCSNASPSPIPAPSPTSNPTGSGETNIEISGFAYNPESITISVGTTVRWTNHDSVPHTVTSDTNLFQSGNLAKGATFRYTFTNTGTFDYHCEMHPSMKGTVIVE